MHLATRSLACLALALAPIACSSGGGGGGGTPVAAASFVGSWDATYTRLPSSCDPNPTFVDTIEVSITVTDGSATISAGPYNIVVPVVDGRIQGYSAFNLTTYDWGLTGADTFSGTQSSGTLGACDVAYDVTATRAVAPAPTPLAQQWVGTWDITAAQASTTCNPDPQFPIQTSAITITVSTVGSESTATINAGVINIDVPIINGRLQGYSPFNLSTYDWELQGSNGFTGTQTSGIPAIGSNPACEVVLDVSATRVGS
ncbi:MAG: hypothetical protein ACI8UD_000394 [Planctomycetota bacterium]|jgi:hypothetical protein